MQAPSRLAAVLGLSLGWAASAYGQNGTQPANILREPLSKTEQKVQNIVVQDDANRIQERRFGGQTERITVTPKANMPEYEVLPDNPSRSATGDGLKPQRGTSGQRVWNIFSF
jgi:hypothetical protein